MEIINLNNINIKDFIKFKLTDNTYILYNFTLYNYNYINDFYFDYFDTILKSLDIIYFINNNINKVEDDLNIDEDDLNIEDIINNIKEEIEDYNNFKFNWKFEYNIKDINNLEEFIVNNFIINDESINYIKDLCKDIKLNFSNLSNNILKNINNLCFLKEKINNKINNDNIKINDFLKIIFFIINNKNYNNDFNIINKVIINNILINNENHKIEDIYFNKNILKYFCNSNNKIFFIIKQKNNFLCYHTFNNNDEFNEYIINNYKIILNNKYNINKFYDNNVQNENKNINIKEEFKYFFDYLKYRKNKIITIENKYDNKINEENTKKYFYEFQNILFDIQDEYNDNIKVIFNNNKIKCNQLELINNFFNNLYDDNNIIEDEEYINYMIEDYEYDYNFKLIKLKDYTNLIFNEKNINKIKIEKLTYILYTKYNVLLEINNNYDCKFEYLIKCFIQNLNILDIYYKILDNKKNLIKKYSYNYKEIIQNIIFIIEGYTNEIINEIKKYIKEKILLKNNKEYINYLYSIFNKLYNNFNKNKKIFELLNILKI